MTIDLENICTLTKLRFPKEEIPPLMEAIQSVTLLAEDFDNCEIPPPKEQGNNHIPTPTAFFDGTPSASYSKKQLLQNAPTKVNDCITVPRTVE